MNHRFTSVALALALAGCTGADAVDCTVDADCASGACGDDGTCVAAEASAAGSPAAGSGGATGGGSATSASAGTGGAGGDDSGVCSANHDFVIERAEVPLEPGLHATFRVATDATVDTAGEEAAEGARAWNLDVDLPGDHLSIAETLDVESRWFAEKFPGATYATRLSDTEDLLGVFELGETALLLRGVVSPEGGLTRTELAYDPPVTVLAFPFHEGDAWSSTSDVTGVTLGVITVATETYESKADAHGTLEAPFGEFDVVRVAVDLTRTIGFVETTLKSFAFVSECFGTVASLRSQDGESAGEFTSAAEVQRLAQ